MVSYGMHHTITVIISSKNRYLDGRRIRNVNQEKTIEEQRKRKIEKDKEVLTWSFATSHLEPYLSWVSLGIVFEWDDYSNLGRDRTRSQKEKEAGECKKYC